MGKPATNPANQPRALPGRTFALLLVLAFLGGYADTGSFVLTSSFTGHLTGNSILIMVNLARGDWVGVAVCVLAVVSFITGTSLGGRWDCGGVLDDRRQLRLPLATEMVLFTIAIAGHAELLHGGQFFFVGCLCLALGLQNGVLQRMGMLSVHTTFITGMWTSLADTLVSESGSDSPQRQSTRRVLGSTIAAFLGGALVGAELTVHGGVSGFAFIYVPAAIALGLATIRS